MGKIRNVLIFLAVLVFAAAGVFCLGLALAPSGLGAAGALGSGMGAAGAFGSGISSAAVTTPSAFGGHPSTGGEFGLDSQGASALAKDAFGFEIDLASADRVVAAPAGLADIWLLAGGGLVGSTDDALDGSLALPDGVSSVGSAHSPDAEVIIALEPDLVILSAATPGHEGIGGALRGAGLRVYYFDVEDYRNYLSVLDVFTDITGRKDLYKANGESILPEINAAIERSKGQPHPKVLLLRGYSAGVSAKNSDSTAGAMLRDLGCVNIADSESGLLDDLSMEAIMRDDPDFIFFVPMGESREKAIGYFQESLQSNPAWGGLAAVRNGRFHVLPKELFHLKPNERWGESYATLADIIYG